MIRAWKQIEKAENGCWIWKGSMKGNGYGEVCRNGKTTAAHRFFYEHFKGKIRFNLEIDHLCRNRGCVNPDHLEAVTHRVNCLRGNSPAAKNIKKTHCPKGHPLSGENLWIRQSRKTLQWCRECRACRRASQATWKKRVGYRGPAYAYKHSDGVIR